MYSLFLCLLQKIIGFSETGRRNQDRVRFFFSCFFRSAYSAHPHHSLPQVPISQYLHYIPLAAILVPRSVISRNHSYCPQLSEYKSAIVFFLQFFYDRLFRLQSQPIRQMTTHILSHFYLFSYCSSCMPGIVIVAVSFTTPHSHK